MRRKQSIPVRLLGVPDDQGVFNVGGRVGAAGGPGAFRAAFRRMKGREDLHASIDDLGDVAGLNTDVRANLARAAQAVTAAARGGSALVVVGGGHDHGFSHLQGLASALPRKARLGCINIDAHLDLRDAQPVITSGSPFFLAIEEGVLSGERLVEFGIQKHCNAPALWKYAERRKVKIVPFEELRGGVAVRAFARALSALEKKCDAVVVSLDLDAAAEAFAPGVSAPQAEGFTSSEVIEMAELAGRSRKVVSLGIFELCPAHDVDGKTARLAAAAAYGFIQARLKGR